MFMSHQLWKACLCFEKMYTVFEVFRYLTKFKRREVWPKNNVSQTVFLSRKSTYRNQVRNFFK